MLTINITEEFKSQEDLSNAIREIARLLDNGYTAGHNPNWTISHSESEL